jgi:hypothetical protein
MIRRRENLASFRESGKQMTFQGARPVDWDCCNCRTIPTAEVEDEASLVVIEHCVEAAKSRPVDSMMLPVVGTLRVEADNSLQPDSVVLRA